VKKVNDYVMSDDAIFRLDWGIVEKSGYRISLSHRQCTVLQILIKNTNTPVSTDCILTQVWGGKQFASRHDVHICIHRIRKKIGYPESKRIISIWGYGYMFQGR
jgi:DNA-binding response OmpR family regulator